MRWYNIMPWLDLTDIELKSITVLQENKIVHCDNCFDIVF